MASRYVAIRSSAATIITLGALTRSATPPERGLDLEAIEQRARTWFAEQESRLGARSGIGIDVVLRRLGDDAE